MKRYLPIAALLMTAALCGCRGNENVTETAASYGKTDRTEAISASDASEATVLPKEKETDTAFEADTTSEPESSYITTSGDIPSPPGNTTVEREEETTGLPAEETEPDVPPSEEQQTDKTVFSETTATDTQPSPPEKHTDPAPVTTEQNTVAAADYAKLAEEMVGEHIEAAIKQINGDRFLGSDVCYPFEKRNAFDKLTSAQKEIYGELYDAAVNIEPFVFKSGSGLTYSDYTAACNALFSDHPALTFYSESVDVTERSRTVAKALRYFLPSDTDITLDGRTDGLLHELALMEAVCELIAERIPENYSTYDKYRYLAAVVSYITDYDNYYVGGIASENAFGALISGRAICRGYAKAFEYLCEKSNLYCGFVCGSNKALEVHMWNIVRLESGTYHVDVTWSDTTYGTTLGHGWMKYFMKTQSETLTNHIIDDGTVANGTSIP